MRLHGELSQAGGQTVLERSGRPHAEKQLFLLEDESRWHAVTGCWYSTRMLFAKAGVVYCEKSLLNGSKLSSSLKNYWWSAGAAFLGTAWEIMPLL